MTSPNIGEKLAELAYRITRSYLSSSVGAFRLDYKPVRELTKDEKARIQDLEPLRKRYGEAGIENILETFSILKGETFAKTEFIVKEEVVKQKLAEVLSRKKAFEKYATERFG